MDASMYQKEFQRMKEDIAQQAEKRKILRELDCFVLDNSLRESTVGQLRGHTIENKWKIYNEVKKCGFKHIVVAAYSHMTRVDDTFCQQLVEKGEDVSTLYSFTEVIEKVGKDGIPDTSTTPVGLSKMQQFGLRNPIIEIDLAHKAIDWEKFTIQDMCLLLLQRMEWTRKELASDARIFINLRDFPDAITHVTERVFTVVSYLSSLPPDKRPFGIIFEEATGKYLPEEVGSWTAFVRRVMDSCGWKSGNLLVHVHEKWALAETTQLECLSSGANGMWASLCEEGAAMGHACSSVTLMNLVRFGNKKVLKQYKCTELRKAAQNVTKITTGRDPHPKQPIYGERALDLAFDFGGIAGGLLSEDEFDMAEFFGEERPVRISTLSDEKLIADRLKDLFGDDAQFTESMAKKMKEKMLEDLNSNRKEEYMSEVGIALLFDRAGGHLTEKMSEVIVAMEYHTVHQEELIGKVQEMWEEWDLKEVGQKDNCLEYQSFYNGFMAPYFGCVKCDDTTRALQAIDMDSDGQVDWNEFLVYLKWAMHQYPEIQDVDELLSIVFRKGIIPAMRDEIIKKAK